jgi:hypothetical protein
MIRIGTNYQAEIPQQRGNAPRKERETRDVETTKIDAFLRRCAVLGLPPAFTGSNGAREEIRIEALRANELDEDRAVSALRAPHANRYDDHEQHVRPNRVNVGDCVFLRAPPGGEPYIALIEKQHANGTITCRWFYRHADLDEACMAATSACPLELFLSPVRDKNRVEMVLGKCTVVPKPNGRSYFCRSLYLPATRTIVAARRVREIQRGV